MFKFQRWFIFAIAFFCFAQVTIDPTTPDLAQWLNGSSAEAKSRGGSSSSRSSSSSSRSSSTKSSSGSSSSSKSSSSTSSPSKFSSSGNTGGRARGGSFDREASPQENRKPSSAPISPATTEPTRPSYPSSYPSRQYTPSRPIYINPEIEIEIEDDDDDKPYPYAQPVPAPYIPGGTPTQPVPSSNSAPSQNSAPYSTPQTETETDRFPWKFIFFLLVVGGGLFFAWYLLSKRDGKSSGASSELSNDIVTVTKLQIALLAEARDIQSQLTDLSLQADLDTPEGLSEFLQETVLALLRHPEYWSHAQSISQAVPSRDEAGRMFETFSIAERRKFGVETLSRTNGRVRSQSVEIDPDIEPAEYIVVTLLVGTEDDRPLFNPIYSAEDLKQALETLAAIPPNALSIFELLWSPQTSTDSLSYDELLTEYTELVPLG